MFRSVLPHLTSLKTFSIYADFPEMFEMPLDNLSRLECFKIMLCNEPTPEMLDRITRELLKCEFLFEIDIEVGSSIGKLPELLANRQIQVLRLRNYHGCTSDSLRGLSVGLRKSKSLRVLDFDFWASFAAGDLKFVFDSITEAKTLRELKLAGRNMANPEAVIDQLAQSLKQNSVLKKIDLQHCSLSDGAVLTSLFIAMEVQPYLQSLILTGIDLSSHFADIAKMQHIALESKSSL
ncbi:hypothetical protein HK098_008286 [Nowakowskiella sp. JEL0407]|nr:hypothetical protein HK098_008286 [Nowakowskiella sp. JEL0407]